MKHEEREFWRQELLEYHYGCHPDPDKIEKRLESDDELRRFYEQDVANTVSLIDRAAEGDVDMGAIVSSVLDEKAPTIRRKRVGVSPWMKAAAVLVVGTLVGLLTTSAWMSAQAEKAYNSKLRLIVEGRSGFPDLSPGQVHIQTRNHKGNLCAATVEWEWISEDGDTLGEGSFESSGETQLDLPASAKKYGRLSLVARSDDGEARCDWLAGAGETTPLGHIRTDRASYLLGDTVYVRGLFLDRLSMEPIERAFYFRVLDPKDEVIETSRVKAQKGTASFSWTPDESMAAWPYRIEWLDRREGTPIFGTNVLIRSAELSRLEKRVTLDRKGYSPGDMVEATLSVNRLAGGPVRHAMVHASLMHGESTAWRDSVSTDENGKAHVFAPIPHDVSLGEGRLVLAVDDSGLVETTIATFDVVSDEPTVHFYPEGGDLIAGVPTRLFVEVQDSAGNPRSLQGAIRDQEGYQVAEVKIDESGRGVVSLHPIMAATYRLYSSDSEFVLPSVLYDGVGLRSVEPVTEPKQPIRMEVTVPDEQAWTVGLFCRGVLVADQVVGGKGPHPVALSPPKDVFGVLRVTVFDESLTPRAERLVYRKSGRELNIVCELDHEILGPGDSQGLRVQVTDDQGRGVPATLAVSVSDRAARLASPFSPMGLRDYVELGGDVDEIENIGEFLAGTEDSDRSLDLLLGTRGWRRFAWYDVNEWLEKNESRDEVVLAQEGLSPNTHRTDSRIQQRERANSYRDRSRLTKEIAIALSVGLVILTVVFFVVRLSWRAYGDRTSNPWIRYGLPALHGVSLFLVLVVGLAYLAGSQLESMAPGQLLGTTDEAKIAATNDALPESELEQLAALGYLPGSDEAGDVLLDTELLDSMEDSIDFLPDLPEEADFERASPRRPVRLYVREYSHKRDQERHPWLRDDHTETVCWYSTLTTGADGTAQVRFDMSDRLTTWDVWVDGHGKVGDDFAIGEDRASFQTRIPFEVDLKLPLIARPGDRFQVPVILKHESDVTQRAAIRLIAEGIEVSSETIPVSLESGAGRGHFDVVIPSDVRGVVSLLVLAQCGDDVDAGRRSLYIGEDRFEKHITHSGLLVDRDRFQVNLPADVVDKELSASVVVYPTPLDTIWDGLDGILRQPHGCFEQVSSSNYPNLLVLSLIETWTDGTTEVTARAQRYLEAGYTKLTGYEVDGGGFDWYGNGPASETLTAYGLMQFVDMAEVFPVEEALLERTRNWLYSRRDGEGGFDLDASRRLYSVPQETADAYVTWSLLYAGEDPQKLASELDRIVARVATSHSAYELALAAHALGLAGREDDAHQVRQRLVSMQSEKGSVLSEQSSWTGSGGIDLEVETTSLAVLAWMQDPLLQAHVEKGMRFILSRRQASGRFGATQATVLALKALVEYQKGMRRPTKPGQLELLIQGEVVARRKVALNTRGAMRMSGFKRRLVAGRQEIELRFDGEAELPWTFDVTYLSERPADDRGAPLALDLVLNQDSIEEGQVAVLNVKATSLSTQPASMGMGIIGIPATLSFQPEQLEQLKERGVIDFWEARDQDLILYWRRFDAEEVKSFALDLVATLPGTATGPASRAYLYYTSQSQSWTDGVTCTVTPIR